MSLAMELRELSDARIEGLKGRYAELLRVESLTDKSKRELAGITSELGVPVAEVDRDLDAIGESDRLERAMEPTPSPDDFAKYSSEVEQIHRASADRAIAIFSAAMKCLSPDLTRAALHWATRDKNERWTAQGADAVALEQAIGALCSVRKLVQEPFADGRTTIATLHDPAAVIRRNESRQERNDELKKRHPLAFVG